MKRIIILPDGVSDKPIASLGNKTPLEVASHPNMDWVAANGTTGLVDTIPEGFAPGSDVGCMSVFGYDPKEHYTGRAPLEAASQGIALKDGDIAFRCNTVTIQDGKMADYSAGHIETEDSRQLILAVNEKLGRNGLRFYPGIMYRHLAVFSNSELAKTECTPAHDVSGKAIESYLPKGPASGLLRQLMDESVKILAEHPVTKRRLKEGKVVPTQLWFWGQGTAAQFPSFRQVYGLRAGCISAVDIVKGLGILTGFNIIPVPGITGYFDTNYSGKAEYALKALEDHDLVLIHVEPTDEAGHMGDVDKKIEAIENTDRLIVGPVLKGLKARGESFAVMIVPDHSTSTELRTHITAPVPYAIYATGGLQDVVTAYTENSVVAALQRIQDGWKLMRFFLKQGKTG